MSNTPTIECVPNGPLRVHGLASLRNSTGTSLPTKEVTVLCRCGGSANQPCCDGTHRSSGFTCAKLDGAGTDRVDDVAGTRITIHDKLSVCAHAGCCTDGLPKTFRHGVEPFIEPDADTAERVIETVNRCPSGALSCSIETIAAAQEGVAAPVHAVPLRGIEAQAFLRRHRLGQSIQGRHPLNPNDGHRELLRLPAALLVAGAVSLLAGCGGTLYATVRASDGDPVMLLGHDPVAYFTLGKPVRGDPKIKTSLPHRTYYFVNEEHRRLFNANPTKYEPQHGGFCSNGTPFKIKLGSDPTEWEIHEGRLFIFGDIVGHSFWRLDPKFNVTHADQVWDEIKDTGWRSATLRAWISPVPWYRSHRSLNDEWNAKHPDKPITFDPGGLFPNLITKYPGWRAREGFGQPALGLVGTDPCPPACAGTVSQGYSPPWAR